MSSAYRDFSTFSDYYRLFHLANAAVCTLLFPLTAYLIAYQSPAEIPAVNRWFLLYAASHGYALAVLFAVFQPMPLFPLMVGTCRGLAHGRAAISALSALMLVLIMQLCIGYCNAFLNYYSALVPLSALSKWYGERRNRVIAFVLLTAVVDVLSVIFQYSIYATPEQLQVYVASMMPTGVLPSPPGMAPQAPSLMISTDVSSMPFIYQLYVNEPDLVGFVTPPIVMVTLSLLVVIMLLVGALVIRLNIGITAAIRATESMVLPSTHQLQQMLQRLFVQKSLFFLAFCVAPMLAISAAIAGAFSTPYVSLFCFFVVSLHSPALLLRYLWMRPYRRWLLGRLGLLRASVAPVPVVAVASSRGQTAPKRDEEAGRDEVGGNDTR